MPKTLQKPDKFKLFSQKTIQKEKAELSRWQLFQLKGKLARGIYWVQIEERGLVHWNWTLLQSYLLHGEDSQEHRKLLSEYLSTLPL